MNIARNIVGPCLSIGAAFALPVLVEATPGVDDDAVIVADRIRTAFLEDAPRNVHGRFKRALDDACRAARSDPPRDANGDRVPFEILCDSNRPLRYLREVLVNGERIEEGWICFKDTLGRTRYFPDDWEFSTGCVRVLWDYTLRKPQVVLE